MELVIFLSSGAEDRDDLILSVLVFSAVTTLFRLDWCWVEMTGTALPLE